MASIVSAAVMSVTFAKLSRPPSGKDTDGGHALGAVYEGKTFLGLEDEGLEVATTQSLHRAEAFTAETDLAFAYDRQCQVSERRQVARGTEGALLGHDRQDVVGEHLDKTHDDVSSTPEWPRARTWARRASMALTSSGGSSFPTATACERKSPCCRAVECSGLRCTSAKGSEAGRDPIDHGASLEGGRDDVAGGINGREDFPAQPGRGAPGDLDDVVDAKCFAKCDRCRLSHVLSIAAPSRRRTNLASLMERDGLIRLQANPTAGINRRCARREARRRRHSAPPALGHASRDDGRTPASRVLEQVEDEVTADGVKFGSGLVGHDQSRFAHECPPNRRPLLLSAGQFARELAVGVFEAKSREHLSNATRDLISRSDRAAGGEGPCSPPRSVCRQDRRFVGQSRASWARSGRSQSALTRRR